MLNSNQSKTKKQIDTLRNINNEIKSLKEEINDISNNYELVEYIDKAWEFIQSFETDENSTIQNETQNETQNNILDFVNKTGKSNKGKEYNRYYNKCFLNINIPQNGKSGSANDCCINCNENEFQLDPKNGTIICNNCGLSEKYIENNSSAVNYNDTMHIETISQPFSYQRKNHFKEWLNQLQGKEVTEIPEEVIRLVILELKKERITDSKDITSERIKKIS